MTVYQYNEKALLDYKCEIEALKIANKIEEMNGRPHKYNEDDFRRIMDYYTGQLNRF